MRRNLCHLCQVVAGLVPGNHKDGVGDQVDGHVLPHQLCANRVDKEWHVIGDDVNDAGVALITDFQVGLARAAIGCQLLVGPGPGAQPFGVISARVFFG